MKFQKDDLVMIKGSDGSEKRGVVIATSPRGYTGKSVRFKIGYLLPIDDKRVVFSILELEKMMTIPMEARG